MKDCAMYFGVYEYLFEFYGDLCGVSHKDLYVKNNPGYDLAVVKEKQEKEESVLDFWSSYFC